MPKFKSVLLSGAATSVLSMFALAAPLHAEEAAVSSLALEEIVVTARKRAESILEAPLSVTAFTSEAMVDRNIIDQTSLATQTPGLDFTAPGGLSTARPVIRGMSQSSRAGDETNVATFIDGVYIDGFSSSSVHMDSLERVEVVRGAQSAQYGRNSFAGAINYITKKPSMDFQAGGSGVIGEDSRFGASAYVNGAVIDDKLAMRVDASYDDTGGYYRDAVSGEHLSARKTYAVRGGFLANVSDVTTALLRVSYSQSHANTFARNAVATDDPAICCRSVSSGAPAGFGTLYVGEMKTNPREAFTYDPRAYAGDDEVFHVNLTLTADWDNVLLTSISGYDNRTFSNLSDQDRTPEGTTFRIAPRGPAAATTSALLVGMQTLSGPEEKRESFSQEVRVESKNNSVVNWAFGGYYSTMDGETIRSQGGDVIFTRRERPAPNVMANSLPVIGADGVVPVAEITFNNTTMISAFGSVDINLTPALTLSAEGRYTWEDKEVNNTFLSAGVGNVGSGLEAASFKYFTPRVILNYKANDDLNLYASVAKGTKSGGVNAGISAVVSPANPSVLPEWTTYDPETAWNYEVGAKFSALDNRIRGSIAAYYVDWTNQQVSNTVFVPSVSRAMTAIANAAKSEVKGVELEGAALIAKGLVANVAYALNQAKYKDAVFSAYAVENADLYGFPGGDASGNRIQNTSKHSVNLGLEYSMPVVEGWDVTGRADYIYRSKQYDTPVNLAWAPDYSTVNLNLTFESEQARIGGYCTNLLNDRDASVGFNSRNINGEVVYQIQPREGRRCGVRFSYKFN